MSNLAVLDKLERTAREHIRKFVEFMKDTEDEENDVYDTLCGEFPSMSKDTIREHVQEESLSLVSDARVVLKELPQLTRFTTREVETIDEIDAPFLGQVWCGDMYDADKYDGLKELINDLKTQTAELTEQSLVNKVVSKLS